MLRGGFWRSTVPVAAALLLSWGWAAQATPVEEPRRVHLGAGAGVAFQTPFVQKVATEPVGFHSSIWAAFPIGAVFGLRPAARLCDVGESFGAGRGARLDLELGFEFTLRLPYVDLVLAVAAAATFRATTERFDLRAIGLGPALGLQGLIIRPLGWYARTTHRLALTTEEAVMLHQLEVGVLFRL